MEPDDHSRELVTRAQGRDRDAIERLLAEQLPALRAFIRLRAGARIRARESCSDLAQSVCREILQDLSGFEYRGEAGFRQWLYTTALRKIIDRDKFYRRDKRDVEREVALGEGEERGRQDQLAGAYRTLGTPSRLAMAREELEAIEAAFDQLPESYREVITLHRVVGLSHAEIAAELGTSEAYSRTMLSRALARLARLLRQDAPPT